MSFDLIPRWQPLPLTTYDIAFSLVELLLPDDGFGTEEIALPAGEVTHLTQRGPFYHATDTAVGPVGRVRLLDPINGIRQLDSCPVAVEGGRAGSCLATRRWPPTARCGCSMATGCCREIGPPPGNLRADYAIEDLRAVRHLT